MNRKKGTSERTSCPQRDSPVIAAYREFVPAPELTGVVRAYFSFAPNVLHSGRRPITREVLIMRDEPFDMPMLAGTATSLVLDLGSTCRVGKGWTVGAPVGARAIGALRSARTPAVNFRPEMIGVYLEPGAAFSLLDIPTVELTDRIVSLEDVWGAEGARLPAQIAELEGAAQVDRLEAALLEHLRPARAPAGSVDVLGLARWAQSKPTAMTVTRLADTAGVSRRHLARVFREVVGLGPKRFCRLARFQRGLRYAGAGPGVPWAQVALELGYTDQSHMIAEFRELGGLTPELLATQRWFHPFIWESRSRFSRSTSS